VPEAIVKKSTGSWYSLLDDKSKEWQARLKGKFKLESGGNTNPIAVGDRVRFSPEPGTDNAIIEEILPRTNYIIRKASNLSRQEHIIAANLDQVIVIATMGQPRTSLGFIDRILVTAEAYHIPPVILFNKKDICSGDDKTYMDDVIFMYHNVGYQAFAISALEEESIDKVTELIKGKISLFTGHSGVGKSTLINALVPELNLKIGEISGFSNKGKHTTTFAEMHIAGPDTYIIDTPGIKEFGIVNMEREEISHYFPEMRDLIAECRFSNCMHENEPGCAVLKALENGEIALPRYQSYLSLINSEDTHR
jgi:ribosome biogenesis GTPase